MAARALALRDYYPFWKYRNERSRAGKLLLLDPDDHDTIQVHSNACAGVGLYYYKSALGGQQHLPAVLRYMPKQRLATVHILLEIDTCISLLWVMLAYIVSSPLHSVA